MAQKTPISLMNELAKANKLTVEYITVEQTGPAHKRTFRIQLVLGEIGKFEGTASSIKAAKHAAASVALEKCGLSLPEKKPKGLPLNITPTVELNGLAMKLGKHTSYRDLPIKYPPFQPHQMGQGFHGPPSHLPYQRMPGHRNYHDFLYHPQVPRIFCVSLTVGNNTYVGEGSDKQKARHAAASKAIEDLRKELVIAREKENDEVDGTLEPATAAVEVPSGNNIEQASKSPSVDRDSSEEKQPDEKSEISIVYEIATKRKLPVNFEEVRNTGPAHMKNFTIRCTVGKMTAEGEGPKKKLAKQHAAQKILEELVTLPPLPEPVAPKGNRRFVRRNARSQYRPKPKGDIDPTLNPISILGQMMQHHHESPPEYKCLQEKDFISHQQFIMQVTVTNRTCKGHGPNKKTAKKNAAEEMLKLLGFRQQPSKGDVVVATSPQVTADNNVEAGPEGSALLYPNTPSPNQPTILGRQLKPGLLPMVPEVAKQMGSEMMNSVVAPIAIKAEKQETEETVHQGGLNRAPGAPVAKPNTVSDILGALKGGSKPLTQVQKLVHLAEVKGFIIQFTDYPKDVNGKQEFITVVTISSVPPITFCGTGATAEEAREEAASHALGPLLQMGLEQNKLCKDGAVKQEKVPEDEIAETVQPENMTSS